MSKHGEREPCSAIARYAYGYSDDKKAAWREVFWIAVMGLLFISFEFWPWWEYWTK